MRQKLKKLAATHNAAPPATPPKNDSQQRQITTRSASKASSDSNGSKDRRNASIERRSTSRIGGDDVDSKRPAKVAQISPGHERSQSSQESTTKTLDSEIINNQDLQGMEGDFHAADDDDGDDDHSLSQSSPEKTLKFAHQISIDSHSIQYPPASPKSNSPEKPSAVPSQLRGGKRPKGWHLRKENRHLRGSPARSERQDSAETHEPGGILKRLPGRRRAPHHDPSIEADMRRQLELKIAYRAVTKALKPVLAELAQRTSDSLEADSLIHCQYDAYSTVTAELDARLQKTLQILDHEYKLEEARLQNTLQAEKDIQAQSYEAKLEDAQDDNLSRCQHAFMSTVRKHEQEEDSDATDDEDGIFQRLHTVRRDTGERVPLDERFDSRSRFFVDTARSWKKLDVRLRLREEQRQHDESSLLRAPKDFAVYDGEQRALARAGLSILTLLDACRTVEQMAATNAREAANAAATGLQALATASELATAAPHADDTYEAPHSKSPKTTASAAKQGFPISSFTDMTSKGSHKSSRPSPVHKIEDYGSPNKSRAIPDVSIHTPTQFQPHAQQNDTAYHTSALGRPNEVEPNQEVTGPVSQYTTLPPMQQYLQDSHANLPPHELLVPQHFSPTQHAYHWGHGPVEHNAHPMVFSGPRALANDPRLVAHHDNVEPGDKPRSPLDTINTRDIQQDRFIADYEAMEATRRKRPGPKAVYSSNDLSGTKTVPDLSRAPDDWSPCVNTIGSTGIHGSERLGERRTENNVILAPPQAGTPGTRPNESGSLPRYPQYYPVPSSSDPTAPYAFPPPPPGYMYGPSRQVDAREVPGSIHFTIAGSQGPKPKRKRRRTTRVGQPETPAVASGTFIQPAPYPAHPIDAAGSYKLETSHSTSRRPSLHRNPSRPQPFGSEGRTIIAEPWQHFPPPPPQYPIVQHQHDQDHHVPNTYQDHVNTRHEHLPADQRDPSHPLKQGPTPSSETKAADQPQREKRRSKMYDPMRSPSRPRSPQEQQPPVYPQYRPAPLQTLQPPPPPPQPGQYQQYQPFQSQEPPPHHTNLGPAFSPPPPLRAGSRARVPLQYHPGQRIGQQLMPATLAPAPTRPASPRSSVSYPYHQPPPHLDRRDSQEFAQRPTEYQHHRQQSSTSSAGRAQDRSHSQSHTHTPLSHIQPQTHPHHDPHSQRYPPPPPHQHHRYQSQPPAPPGYMDSNVHPQHQVHPSAATTQTWPGFDDPPRSGYPPHPVLQPQQSPHQTPIAGMPQDNHGPSPGMRFVHIGAGAGAEMPIEQLNPGRGGKGSRGGRGSRSRGAARGMGGEKPVRHRVRGRGGASAVAGTVIGRNEVVTERAPGNGPDTGPGLASAVNPREYEEEHGGLESAAGADAGAGAATGSMAEIESGARPEVGAEG